MKALRSDIIRILLVVFTPPISVRTLPECLAIYCAAARYQDENRQTWYFQEAKRDSSLRISARGDLVKKGDDE